MSSRGKLHILHSVQGKKPILHLSIMSFLHRRNNFAHHKSVGVKLFVYRIEVSVNFSVEETKMYQMTRVHKGQGRALKTNISDGKEGTVMFKLDTFDCSDFVSYLTCFFCHWIFQCFNFTEVCCHKNLTIIEVILADKESYLNHPGKQLKQGFE